MPHLEVETKFQISHATFEKLKSLGSVVARSEQLNIYYDQRWRLAESSATLRIRFDRNSAPTLTLKLPVSVEEGKRSMWEFEFPMNRDLRYTLPSRHPISIQPTDGLPSELCESLLRLGITRLNRVGWMRTTRVVLLVENLGTIELDRVELPDKSLLCEAEIEASSGQEHDALVCWLRCNAPDAEVSRLSKFQRFRIAAAARDVEAGSSPKMDLVEDGS